MNVIDQPAIHSVLTLLFHDQKNKLTVILGRSALAEMKGESSNLGSSKITTEDQKFSLDTHRHCVTYAQEMSLLNERARKLILDPQERWECKEWIELLSWIATKLQLEDSFYVQISKALKKWDQENSRSIETQLSVTSSHLLEVISQWSEMASTMNSKSHKVRMKIDQSEKAESLVTISVQNAKISTDVSRLSLKISE